MSVRETRGAVSSSRAELPRHELIGPAEAPVVLALGGISADAHVCAHDEDPRDGWWEGIVGSGRAIDPRGVRVLGVDYLDAGVRADGRPAGIVTTHDQADAIARTLDLRGIEAVSAIVGASYGGMVALSFAEATDRRVSVRIECRPCRPFGVATYDTVGAVRDVRVRRLTAAEVKAIKKEK